jgi:hypothetical protein
MNRDPSRWIEPEQSIETSQRNLDHGRLSVNPKSNLILRRRSQLRRRDVGSLLHISKRSHRANQLMSRLKASIEALRCTKPGIDRNLDPNLRPNDLSATHKQPHIPAGLFGSHPKRPQSDSLTASHWMGDTSPTFGAVEHSGEAHS